MKGLQRFAFCSAMLIVYGVFAQDVNRSFLSVRPGHSHISDQELMLDQHFDTGRVVHKGDLRTALFGSLSTNQDALARYFMFDGKEVLRCSDKLHATINGDLSQDILAGDFNVATEDGTFLSTITMAPRQSIIGLSLSIKKHISEYWWGACELPLVYVRNDLQLVERLAGKFQGVISSAGIQGESYVASMIDAFRQSGMHYGRIDGVQSKCGFGDLVVKIGYDSVDRSDLYMTIYGGLVIPTSNKPKAEYMFEAITGNNGHVGLLFGSRGQFNIAEYQSGSKLWVSWGGESEYLFANSQKRSFDLKNNPWSRYCAMYANEYDRFQASTNSTIAQKTFGINLMTKEVNVTPGLHVWAFTKLHYILNSWYCNVGLHTYMRQSETISPINDWNLGPMIASYSAPGNTIPYRTIGQAIAVAEENVNHYIKQSDIDLKSASQPDSLSQMLVFSCGKYDVVKMRGIEFGTSYEYSKSNSVLNRCGLWTAVHGSF